MHSCTLMGLDDLFFPGSDDELGFLEEDSDNKEETEEQRYGTNGEVLHVRTLLLN